MSTLDYTTGLGADHATYCASVAVPSNGSANSRALAVGTYAQACFAFEIHQAFLVASHERAVRIPEARVRILGFSRGEAAKPFHICKVRGVDATRSDHSPEPTATAIAISAPAELLVWRHFEAMNRTTSQQLLAIPHKKCDVNAQVRQEYISSGMKAAREYYAFRAAVVAFIRCRHVVQQKASGRRIFEEFEVRGGSVAAAPPAPRITVAAAPAPPMSPPVAAFAPVAALLGGGGGGGGVAAGDVAAAGAAARAPDVAAAPLQYPSPLTGPFARRLQRRALAQQERALALGMAGLEVSSRPRRSSGSQSSRSSRSSRSEEEEESAASEEESAASLDV